MKKIACLSFTNKGKILGNSIVDYSIQHKKRDEYAVDHYINNEIPGGIKSILSTIVKEYDGLVFISATGIAVRMISPYIKNKTLDPAVVVVDDLGKFSISLLSGHIGGGNKLANWIGKLLGAIPVITTASDNRGIESIDIFAMKNDYYVEDMESIKKITAMMVNGKKIGFYSEMDKVIKYDNLIYLNSLKDIDNEIEGIIAITSIKDLNIIIPHTILRPKNINIGIGCRKGVDDLRIIKAIEEEFNKANLSTKSIKSIGTIEVKKDEQGIIEAAKYFNCPLKIFTLDEIKEVEDRFKKSQFVKDTVGVYSVSEPCAYLLGGNIISYKTKYNGITISLAKETNMAKLYVVGIGPGGREHMTFKAVEAIKKSDVIVGYTPYIKYLGDLVEGKELFSTGMKGEIERCKIALKQVRGGKNTAIISTGDAGLYGMAGPILELKEEIELEIIPGITAAFSAASELGSPIMHDYASISLSDLMTPWEVIENRIEKAAEGDFVITIYNPRSKGRKDHLEKAVNIILKHQSGQTPVGIVKNSGRPGTKIILTNLDNINYEKVDMQSILIIGNSNTYIKNGQMITPRGYHIK